MDQNLATNPYTPQQPYNNQYGPVVDVVDPKSSFMWDHRRRRAAELMADTRYTTKDIADVTGLRRSEVDALMSHKEFAEVVESYRQEQSRSILSSGVASREFRVTQQNLRHKALAQLLHERSSITNPESPFFNPEATIVPGASTGLLIPQLKALGSGPNQEIVTEWQLDRNLLSALKEVEELSAVETGQRQEKKIVEHTGKMYIGIELDRV